MEEKIILTQEEIQNLKNLQEELNIISLELGNVEIQLNTLNETKLQIFQKLTNLKQKQQETGTALNTKYGSGTIDLVSGEFIKAK